MNYSQVYFGFKERKINTFSLNYHSLDLKQSSRYTLTDMDNSSLVFKV